MTASPLKDAIMDAVYVPLERDDMQTPCTLPFMTSSEHGVCDGDGCPVSDEAIASALNAVAKIQAEYHKVKKGTQKGTQKEMNAEPSPRPWRVSDGFLDRYSTGHRDIVDAKGEFVAVRVSSADAALVVDAVNSYAIKSPCRACAGYAQKGGCIADERDRLRNALERIARYEDGIVGCIESGHASGIDWDGITFAMIQEARAALGEEKE